MTPPSTSSPGLDAAFLRRVYPMSLVMAVLGGLVAAALASWRWGLGFTVMALWSTANVRALEALLRLTVVPSGRKPVAIAVAILIKIPILYGVGVFIALNGGFSPYALIAGFSVPLAVILLKILGLWLAERTALHAPAGQPPHRS